MTVYLQFVETENGQRKTRRVSVRSLSSGQELGEIVFYPWWHWYTFMPRPDLCTVWSVGCLREVMAQLEELNAELRAERKAREAKP